MKMLHASFLFLCLLAGVGPLPAAPREAEAQKCNHDNCKCGCASGDPCRCAVAAGATLEWHRWSDSDEYALLRDGKQIGSWNAARGVYRPLVNGEWGPKQGFPADVPPINPPAEGGPTSPDGVEVQCEVPVAFRTRNIGSRVDGSGMCVTTSSSVAAKWSGLDGWVGIRDWAARFPGGSWPSKQLEQLSKYGKEKNLGVAPWAQYVGKNPGPFLDAVLRSGRVACVSWMNGGHWLNLVHLDETRACIMDNNGDPNSLQWMSRESAIRQINSPYAWVGCWLSPGPPPPPRNPGAPVVRRSAVAYGPAPATGGCSELGVHLVSVEGDEYNVRGEPSNLEELRAILGNGTEPYLTVIGDGAAASADLAANPLLAPFVRKLRTHVVPADHWSVSLGHSADAPTVIYLQRPDGVVIHRQGAYEGPDGLARALRKADPAYDPASDPNLATPPSPLGGMKWPANLPPLPVCALGAAGLYFLLKKETK